MAYAVTITGANLTLGAPRGRDDVEPVRCFRNTGQIITRWQIDDDELEEIVRTRSVYLAVLGHGMAPVFIGSESAARSLSVDYGSPLPKQEYPS